MNVNGIRLGGGKINGYMTVSLWYFMKFKWQISLSSDFVESKIWIWNVDFNLSHENFLDLSQNDNAIRFWFGLSHAQQFHRSPDMCLSDFCAPKR